jgi:septin family protein
MSNYYTFNSILVGASKTGKTSFFNQFMYGKDSSNGLIERVGSKDFKNIAGKSMVRLIMEDMPPLENFS